MNLLRSTRGEEVVMIQKNKDLQDLLLAERIQCATLLDFRKGFFSESPILISRVANLAINGLINCALRQTPRVNDPNRRIAEGYDSVMVDLKDGESVSGVLKSESESELVLQSADGTVHTLSKSEIESRRSTLSPMPEGLIEMLTKRELRDLIEYLAQP